MGSAHIYFEQEPAFPRCNIADFAGKAPLGDDGEVTRDRPLALAHACLSRDFHLLLTLAQQWGNYQRYWDIPRFALAF